MAADGIIDLSAEAERRRNLMQLAAEIVEKADSIAAFYALERAWNWGREAGINEAIGIAEASLGEIAGGDAAKPARPTVRRPRRQEPDPRMLSLFEAQEA